MVSNKTGGRIMLAALIIFFIVTITVLWIEINNAVNSQKLVCRTNANYQYSKPYPPNSKALYGINFNTTIMQPNFVYYISTRGGNRCDRCRYFKNDPYNMDNITYSDYTHSGFDRGHLVPNADYGEKTFYITNVVPMEHEYNAGVWAKSEQFIRTKYHGYLVYKGCLFTDRYEVLPNGKRLYIPYGCYYIVFDSKVLPKNGLFTGSVLDYGYLEMIDGAKDVKKMPYWISC